MYATDFEYDGEKLSDYGMMICNIDGGGGIETVSSGADISFQQVKPSAGNYFHLYSSVYESSYTTTFQICKIPYNITSQEDMYLSADLVSAVQRWLCRKNGYYRFKIYQKSYEHIYWNATFSCRQIQLDGQIIGLELTLLTDSPFAYMDEISAEYECKADTSFSLYDNSDEEGFIRPDVEITILSAGTDKNGTFILKNELDENNSTQILNCKIGEIIKIDGRNQIITSSLPLESHNLSTDFNYYFPKIHNRYEKGRLNNKNTFTPNLNCNIKIIYSPIRKAGL